MTNIKIPIYSLHIDGKLVGVQVTQFVLNDYLFKFNQAKRICRKLSKFISDEFLPPIKINIQISTPWDNNQLQKKPIKVLKNFQKKLQTV